MIPRLLLTMARSRILGKSPLGAYLHVNAWIWARLPQVIAGLSLVHAYGHLLQALVRLHGHRTHYLGTFFFRNRPELELIRRLSHLAGKGRSVRMAVLGCSNGAEVYSIVASLRWAQPPLKFTIHAVDISSKLVAVAREGLYSLGVSELVNEPILERMTDDEVQRMFDTEGNQLRVKARLREGIEWHVADANDPHILDTLGYQDVVVANRFLCHMEPVEAESCLRNIAGLVDVGGYLFVSGIDLDVRTKVAKDLGWEPVEDLMEGMHDGDPSLRRSWPCKYWGLEALDRRRDDWKVRYASVFRLGKNS